MARVPLIGEGDKPELNDTIEHLKKSRGGKLINLYRMLLHSPDVALAWNQFNSAIRFQSALTADVRELAILRVSILNGAEYQVKIHGPRYAREAGLTEAQVESLAKWVTSDVYSPVQRAVLAYADAMTQKIDVPATVYAELRNHFDNREIVELTVLIGAYNMHTRVTRALELDVEGTTQKH